MAFDQTTRNRLARFVGEARALLAEEFTRQLQHEYGLDPASGAVTDLDRLTALDDARRETARILRETLDYYLAGKQASAKNSQEVLDRIVHEQAFTVLNRLCALHLAEARGIILEAVTQGYRSKGFQLYARLAGSALGETGEAYRTYLFSLFDELAVELPPLFDRFSPQGRLFPREGALLKLLDLLNNPELEGLWAEDETIGWIYQYFNSREERQAMRAASQAPRSSRELAVRNQFFTPRYVVEFLTDNTLGRIWYEMTKGDTALKEISRYLVRRPIEIFLREGEEAPAQAQPEEELSQEELLRQPVHIPHRLLKDPRDIKMLDPACGSMHFGLYAFDLFEQIYAEAWELEEALGQDALWRIADLDSLHLTYRDKEAFLRDVPRLIIERNIYGIDIDPRAVQIAGLSLWLRAQRSWQLQGVRPQSRPPIRNSKVVCAEPMPGDRGMLEEFLATLQEDRLGTLMRKVLKVPSGQKVRTTKAMIAALAKLVRTVWQEMELAGEAGSLLKIEETLRDAIAQARKQAEEKAPLFRVLEFGLKESAKEQYIQALAGEEQDFWDQAETLVLAALQVYEEQAANGGSFQRRLFADDATRGFAFIDLCRKRYDVVLMNPPFGESIKTSRETLTKHFPNTKHDLFAAFCERALQLSVEDGLIGEISSRVGFFLKTFENWRNDVLASVRIVSILDLGSGVLDDATVEAACYVLNKKTANSEKHTVVFRLLVDEDKEAALSQALNNPRPHSVFHVGLNQFAYLPLSPFIYWVSSATLKRLSQLPTFEPNMGLVRQGLGTGDNNRFIRAIWEVPPSQIGSYSSNQLAELRQNFSGKKRWAFHVRSGSSQPWYSPLTLVIDWENQGARLKEHWIAKGESPSRYIPSEDLYFRPGFSWTLRAFRLIPYLIPSGCIPSASRYMAFPKDHKEIDSLGLCASNITTAFMRFYGEMFERPKHLVDTLKRLPIIDLNDDLKQELLALIRSEVSKRRDFYRNYEPFSEFTLPAKVNQWVDVSSSEWNPHSFLGEELEQKIAQVYGLSVSQLRELEFDLGESIQVRRRRSKGQDTENPSEDEEEKSDVDCDISQRGHTSDLISYFFGCAVGHWDIRYATGEKPAPDLPDPFAPLPACPPGMLQNAEGMPAAPNDVPKDYPLRISWDGILVDDEGHPEDVEGRVREALHVIWHERTEAIEQETCQILGVRTLLEYLRKPVGFFAEHLKRYSKSRRQAPIYWPLSTPSCSYTLWLYYHRLNDQILFTCVNDFVDPKLKQVSEEAARLRAKKGRSAIDEKELERLTDFERELKDFRVELLRVAAFWKPNLNDGVEITAAPLWKLFQHRPWQKRLKETWGRLENGDYDWAHLAYSIWPERVREKCKADKSLAITHGLEDLYVEKPGVKGRKGKSKKAADLDEMDALFEE